MNDVLIKAIERGELLRVWYGGGWRVIEPFTLGRGSKGQLLLRAFQTSGFSQSGEQLGWKLFRVDEITNGAPTGEKFTDPRPGYNPHDSIMKGGIIASFSVAAEIS